MTDANQSIRINYDRIDVVDFLEELGIRNVRDDGLEVFYSCPFPGHTHDDATPSASMKQGSTVAYCFGCGWSGNALKFLSDYEGVSPLVAARWIRQRFGDDFQEPEGSFLEEIDTILAGIRKREDITPGILDDIESYRRQVNWREVADNFDTAPHQFQYMLERGFSPEILTEFEIGWDAISQRITIPYRDVEGKLLGFKARAYLEDQKPRYWTLGGPEYGFEPMNVSQALFGINKALLHGAITIVEGELNALSIHQKGYGDCVGISGRYLSDAQGRLIVKHFRHAIVIMDEMKDMVEVAHQLLPYMPVSIVEDHDKDPAEMTNKEFDDLFFGRIPYLLASLPTS